jgi:hypothetical protein
MCHNSWTKVSKDRGTDVKGRQIRLGLLVWGIPPSALGIREIIMGRMRSSWNFGGKEGKKE